MLFFHFTFLSLWSYNTFKTIDATTQRNKSLRTLAIFICNKRDFIKCGLKSCWNMKFIIKMMKWAIFPPKPTDSVSASVLIACCNKRWVHFLCAEVCSKQSSSLPHVWSLFYDPIYVSYYVDIMQNAFLFKCISLYHKIQFFWKCLNVLCTWQLWPPGYAHFQDMYTLGKVKII